MPWSSTDLEIFMINKLQQQINAITINTEFTLNDLFLPTEWFTLTAPLRARIGDWFEDAICIGVPGGSITGVRCMSKGSKTYPHRYKRI